MRESRNGLRPVTATYYDDYDSNTVLEGYLQGYSTSGNDIVRPVAIVEDKNGNIGYYSLADIKFDDIELDLETE